VKPQKLVFLLCCITFHLILGCKSRTAYVYSVADDAIVPTRRPLTFFQLSDSASIPERNIAKIVENEIGQAGFKLTSKPEEAEYVWTFALDRKTEVVGTSTNGGAATNYAFGVSWTAFSSNTTYIKQTNLTLYMQLSKSSGATSSAKLPTVWEGQITVERQVFEQFKNSLVRALLNKFGTNFENKVKLDKSYQSKVLARQMAGQNRKRNLRELIRDAGINETEIVQIQGILAAFEWTEPVDGVADLDRINQTQVIPGKELRVKKRDNTIIQIYPVPYSRPSESQMQ